MASWLLLCAYSSKFISAAADALPQLPCLAMVDDTFCVEAPRAACCCVCGVYVTRQDIMVYESYFCHTVQQQQQCLVVVLFASLARSTCIVVVQQKFSATG